MTEGLKLFVDDIRPAPEGWERCRTVSRAIRLLATTKIDQISLDHDIMFISEDFRITGCSDEDFSTVALYIRAMPREQRPRVVRIHTANPNGADRIRSILEGEVDSLIRDDSYGHEWVTWVEKQKAQDSEEV